MEIPVFVAVFLAVFRQVFRVGRGKVEKDPRLLFPFLAILARLTIDQPVAAPVNLQAGWELDEGFAGAAIRHRLPGGGVLGGCNAGFQVAQG